MWEEIHGRNPVLLTAGHAKPHMRNGQEKVAEYGTETLLKNLCVAENCFGIVSTEVQLDPNWHIDAPLRKRVRQMLQEHAIKCVFDIHGRRADWPRLLDVYPNNSFKNKYQSLLDSFNVYSFLDNEQLTICEELDDGEIPAIEFEIREDGRNVGSAEFDVVEQKIQSLLHAII